MTKISIILPIYNVEEYLPKALDCLINQTLKDIEIICVEDCSLDDSLKILEGYSKKDARIRIIRQKINQGQGVARNIGIDVAQGEYIMFLDPDDWYELNACEIFYNTAKNNSANVVESAFVKYYPESDKYIITDNYKKLVKEFGIGIKPNQFVNIRNYSNYQIQYYELGPCYKIFSREFLKSNNIYFAPYRRAEDQPFMFQVKMLTNIFYIDTPLYTYLIREDSSRSYQPLYEEIVNEIKKFVNKHKEDPFIQKQCNNYVVWRYLAKYRLSYKNINFIKFFYENKQFLTAEQIKQLIPIIFYKTFSTIFRNIFSITNSKNREYKIITILCMQIKISC